MTPIDVNRKYVFNLFNVVSAECERAQHIPMFQLQSTTGIQFDCDI